MSLGLPASRLPLALLLSLSLLLLPLSLLLLPLSLLALLLLRAARGIVLIKASGHCVGHSTITRRSHGTAAVGIHARWLSICAIRRCHGRLGRACPHGTCPSRVFASSAAGR